LHLARRILVLTGSRSGLQFEPLPQDDPVRRQPDISRAKALLGWRPKTSLNTGLRATVAYFRRQLEENPPTSRRRTIPFIESAARLQSRPVPAAEEVRAAAMGEAAPTLPPSSA